MPIVLREAFPNGPFGWCRNRMEDLAVTGERSSENDEPIVGEAVHEARVVAPAVLLS